MELQELQAIINKAMSETRYKDYDGENTHFDGYDLEEYIGDYQNSDYKFSEVEHFGGEGQGDSMWKVFEVKNLNTDEVTNFRVSGYYDSWNGTEWDGELEVVETYEVKVTKWRSIK